MVMLKPYHGKQIMWKDIYTTYFLSQWQWICSRYFRWCLHAKGGEKWSSSEWKGFVCLNESLGKLEVWRRWRGKCTTCAQGSAVYVPPTPDPTWDLGDEPSASQAALPSTGTNLLFTFGRSLRYWSSVFFRISITFQMFHHALYLLSA